MKKEEIHELHEHADQAKHYPSLVPVTFTMAVLAVFVAAVSLLGHRTHTHELLLQNQSTNQWAYFQAKNIRRHFGHASDAPPVLLERRRGPWNFWIAGYSHRFLDSLARDLVNR